MNKNTKKIITTSSLQGYFFDQLHGLNNKSLYPVPDEVIYYSSDMMERYSLSSNYFEDSNGRVTHKVLGIKLLEATQLSVREQFRVYQDVGDTSLLLCGCFAPSLESKMLTNDYYSKIGKMAYGKLNTMGEDNLNFYNLMSTFFEGVAKLISVVSTESLSLTNDLYEKDFLISNKSCKIS